MVVTWESKLVSPSSLNRRGKFIVFQCWVNANTGQKLPKILCHLQMKNKSKDEGKAHSTASETDEVFEALEMAEGVGSKLEDVLKKLEKLDTIESRLSQMHTTLASTEENVSRLDSDVEDLKTKSKQLGSTVNELKESIQFNEEDISDLKLENRKVQQDVCELQKQLLYMETYSRRENVKFVGLLEEQVDNMNGGDEDRNGAQETNRRYKSDCL